MGKQKSNGFKQDGIFFLSPPPHLTKYSALFTRIPQCKHPSLAKVSLPFSHIKCFKSLRITVQSVRTVELVSSILGAVV